MAFKHEDRTMNTTKEETTPVPQEPAKKVKSRKAIDAGIIILGIIMIITGIGAMGVGVFGYLMIGLFPSVSSATGPAIILAVAGALGVGLGLVSIVFGVRLIASELKSPKNSTVPVVNVPNINPTNTSNLTQPNQNERVEISQNTAQVVDDANNEAEENIPKISR